MDTVWSEQSDDGVRNAGFAGVAEAIVVEVLENAAADGAGASGGVAEVSGEIFLIICDGDGGSVSGADAVEVEGWGVAGWRRRDPHLIGAGLETCEEVLAGGVGVGGGDESGAGGIVELDGEAGDAFFIGVLRGIAIPVAEHGIADLAATDGNGSLGDGVALMKERPVGRVSLSRTLGRVRLPALAKVMSK